MSAPTEAPAIELMPAPACIQVTRDRYSRGDDQWLRVDKATASDLQAQLRISRRGSFRRTWTEGVLAQFGPQLTEGVQLGDVWPALREACNARVASSAAAAKEETKHV